MFDIDYEKIRENKNKSEVTKGDLKDQRLSCFKLGFNDLTLECFASKVRTSRPKEQLIKLTYYFNLLIY